MGTEVKDIPQIRQVFYGTYASLPTAGLKPGDLGYATDRLVLYRWNGLSWDPLTVYSSSGLDASIPAAADLPEGSIYFATDTTKLYQVQSAAWVDISAAWVPPAINLKVKTETRDMTAASGDVSYTGYGFTPVGLLCFAKHTSGKDSIGMAEPAKNSLSILDATIVSFYGNFIDITPSAGNGQSAIVKSYDADGFTLTWTKTGAPTGTASLFIIALKS